MSLPNTYKLDIISRAGPATFTYTLVDKVNTNTGTLDYISRAQPAPYVYAAAKSVVTPLPATPTHNVIIYVGGIDVTDSINMGSLSINDEITSKINTCSFNSFDVNGEFIPTTSQEVRVVDPYDNVIFAGQISQVSQKRSGINPALDTELLSYSISCQDYTRILSRKLIIETYQNMTVLDIITAMINKYYPNDGLTLNNVETGPLIEQITFNYKTGDKAIEDLAKTIGYDWYVDYDKDIHFFSSGTPTSFFTITDQTTNWSDLTIKPDTSQLRNRVYVRGGIYYSDPYTQTILADGVQNDFTLAYTPSFDNFSLTVDGSPVTVGLKNVDDAEDFDFLLDRKEKNLTLGESVWAIANKPLLAGQEVDATYNYEIPILTVQEDSESINSMIALEGGSGVYEYVILDKNISSIVDARARAEAELRDYANPVVVGSVSSIYTYGIKSGMLLTINSDRRNLHADYLIQSVRISQITPTQLVFDISFSGRVYGFVDVLISLFKQQQNVLLGVDEVLDAFNSFNDSVTISTGVPTLALGAGPYKWSNDAGTTPNKMRWSLFQWA